MPEPNIEDKLEQGAIAVYDGGIGQICNSLSGEIDEVWDQTNLLFKEPSNVLE